MSTHQIVRQSRSILYSHIWQLVFYYRLPVGSRTIIIVIIYKILYTFINK